MKSHEAESRVEKAFDSIKPDILESVISDSISCTGNIIDFKAPERKKPRYSYWLRTAAVLLVCLMCFGGLGLYSSAYAVKSTVILEAASPAELMLNSGNRVISAKNVASPENLKGLPVNEAVDIVLDTALAQGSISADENSVLLSVECKDSEAAEELRQSLRAELFASLKERGLDASVMSQTGYNTKEAEALSARLNISPGKAAVICSMSGSGQELDADVLASMSINDLNIIINCTGSRPEGLDILGSASMGLYLDESEAQLAAEAEIGLNKSRVRNLQIELGLDNGELVYSLNFDSGIYSYSCDVDALSGAVYNCSEDLSTEFSGWLSQQSEGLRSWVNENTDKLQHMAENPGSDIAALIESCIGGVTDLAEGVIEGVVSLIDLFLS